MSVSLDKCLKFAFVMRDNGAVVAMGKASAVMLYEMERAFAFGIGGKEHPEQYNYIRGEFCTLGMIIATPLHATDCWQSISADGRIFDFWYQREFE